VLDELGIASAHVAGISLGGVVAQELALRRPERVRSLTLMATSAAGPRHVLPDPRLAASAAARIAAGSVRRRRPWIGPALFSSEFLAREPAAADALLRLVAAHRPAPWGVLGQWAAAGLQLRDLGRIAAPTLIVHGERDVAVSKVNAERLARAIPGAQLRILPGQGHGFQIECLPETVAMVCDWLESC
jgi:pimeloyl-ACP methyl ester carboxylesterase